MEAGSEFRLLGYCRGTVGSTPAFCTKRVRRKSNPELVALGQTLRIAKRWQRQLPALTVLLMQSHECKMCTGYAVGMTYGCIYGVVAQLVEYLVWDQGAAGSSPVYSTNKVVASDPKSF